MNRTATKEDVDAFVGSASQIFAYYSWYVEISPRLLGTLPRPDEMLHFRITEIAVCTGFLMNMRRLDEFFRLKSNRPNDVRASDFGFSKTDGFLRQDLRTQINKHIAHPTQIVSGSGEHTYLIYQLAHKALVAVIEFLDFILVGPHPVTTSYGKSVAYTKAKYLWCWRQYTAIVPAEERLSIGEPVTGPDDPGMKVFDDLWITQSLAFVSFVDPILSQIKAAVPLIAPERAKEYFDLVAETPIQLVLEYKDRARYSASVANGKVFVGVDGLERSWAYSYLFAGGYAEFVERTSLQIGCLDPGRIRQQMSECFDWAIEHDLHGRRPVYPDELPHPNRDLSQATAIEKLHYNTYLGAIAWITLHEISHVVLRHPTDIATPLAEQKRHEFEADAWATDWLLSRAPEDWRVFRMNGIIVGVALAAFLELWRENNEPEAAPSDHPTYPERLVAVLDRFVPLCGSIEQQYGAWVAGTVLIHQRAKLGNKEHIFEGISPFTNSRAFILKAKDAYPKG